MHACMDACMDVCMYACMHACMYVCICKYSPIAFYSRMEYSMYINRRFSMIFYVHTLYASCVSAAKRSICEKTNQNVPMQAY